MTGPSGRAARTATAFIAAISSEIDAGAPDPELRPTYTQAAPAEQLYAGLERYWQQTR